MKEGLQLVLGRFARLPSVRSTFQRLVRARMIPHPVWARIPVLGDFEFTFGQSRFRMWGERESRLSRILCWRGPEGFEYETLTVLSKLLPACRLMFDIGANHGLYTLFAASVNPLLNVVAFEPSPDLYELLRRNIALNGWTVRCTAIEAAVSDREGILEFRVPRQRFAGHARLAEVNSGDNDMATIAVATMRLESILEEQRVSLIKIDVEGAEHLVLRGLGTRLARDLPLVVIEVLEGPHLEDVERILSEHHYRFYHIRESGPVSTPRLVPDIRRERRNYLCVPAAPHADVAKTWGDAIRSLE